MRTTIVDVAKRAGVSVATVSRVVNGNYPVKEETRERVEAAVKALDYVPNLQARELNTRKSSTIGVVVPSFDNMFFAGVLNGIESALREDAFSLLLACAQNDSLLEERCVRDLIARNVSGVIVVSPNTATIASRFYESATRRVPLVFINSYEHVRGISYVSSDERGGAKMALEHLFSYGHRRVLFVRGEKSDSYRIKEEVYREFMSARHLFYEEDIINVGAGNSLETVENTMYQLMDLMMNMQATAIFCCNDLMAAGAVNACQRMGRRVPHDVSVVGYDNIPLSRLITPKLTTIDQKMTELGEAAARLMMAKIAHESPQDTVLQNALVERETTGYRVEA